MKSLWNDQKAAAHRGDLALRVYSSRLLGRDKSLVLHGGGNTSVKIRETNILGEAEDILYVKGSGWDLETITEEGFAPVRMAHLLRLAGLEQLSDSAMSNEMQTHCTRRSAPPPSVEAILHALLPYKYVDHTHADAFIAISNTKDGRERLKEIYGDRVVYIPYVMPGFDLSRLCAKRFPREAGPNTIGMVLEHHGLFSFGDHAKESYERMIKLVTLAERHLKTHKAWSLVRPAVRPSSTPARESLSRLRQEISTVTAFPVILSARTNSRTIGFARRPDLKILSQQGPATPDHVIRTKRLPMLGRDLAAYASDYQAYFERHSGKDGKRLTMLDAAPRVLPDKDLGLLTVGKTAGDAEIVADIYEHTIDIMDRATRLGGWQALSARDLFDVEYWELEQAKLQKAGRSPLFAGEIALVTGAASGIGKACVESLLARGAAVIGLDINPGVSALHQRPDFLGLACDLTSENQIRHALELGVRQFGGLDMLILNAGIFPAGCEIAALKTTDWRRVLSINLDANLCLLRECHPLLKLAPRRGRVAIIGSKNVPAPGPGAAAYSASKAAVTQLMRVAALEWGKDGIRLNSLHPNAVFDTGLWTDQVLASRAKHYGLTVEQYKKNNLLQVEVTSRDVAELAAELCGPLFARSTAVQIPIDGGNERVI